jgi:hypothetical protein
MYLIGKPAVQVQVILSEAAKLGLEPERIVAREDEEGFSIYFCNGQRFGEIEYYEDGELVGLLDDRSTELIDTFDIVNNTKEIRTALKKIKRFLYD